MPEMRMIDAQAKDWLKHAQDRVYIACIGEEGYPNVTVRQVQIVDDKTLAFTDQVESRSVQLMIQNPRLVLNLPSATDPFHGLKYKAKAAFHPVTTEGKADQAERVQIILSLEEKFSY